MTEFREILVLGVGRSGSNLLCSILRSMKGNAGFFEIMKKESCVGLQHIPDVAARIQQRFGASASEDDPAVVAARDADPPAFFDALAAASAAEGHVSMTCKIFGNQITIPHLEQILARPNLAVIFLSRTRIDRFISGQKGHLTKAYIKEDYTDLRPTLDVSQFLRQGFENDRLYDAMLDCVIKSGVRYSFLNYDRDLDIAADARGERIEAALQAIGFAPPGLNPESESWLAKQDKNPNWRDKVANGFEAAAALAGLGLLDWAQSSPLTGHSVTRSVPAKPASFDRDETLLDRYSNFFTLSADPLITFSAIDNDRSYLAEWMGHSTPTFPLRRGLHFVKPTWDMETSPLGPLLESFRRAERANTGHRFVVLHASEIEAARYRDAGQLSVACNGAVFTDEKNFSLDAEPFPGLVSADALYIARFADWKNHHLAAALDRPLFVYSEPKGDEARRHDEMRDLCPSAQFVNHLAGEGTYRYFNRLELNAIMSRARVSLALSTNEGFMRGSIESLLAGLPVLSVEASGGRDAFYTADTALIVDPTAAAVRAGVAELSGRGISRSEVRRVTLDLLSQARRRFLDEANRLAHAEFGPLAPEITLEPLLDYTVRYSTLRKALELMA